MQLHELKRIAREHPNEPATAKFTTEAGALMRGPAKRTLTDIGFKHDVEIKVLEHKGLLDSDLHIKVKGRARDVESAVSEYFRRVELWNEIDEEPEEECCDLNLDPKSVAIACLVVVALSASAVAIVLIF